MSDAVERVGNAIVEQTALQNKGELFLWHPDALAAVAIAAIQALRTPNESILKILREGIVMDGYEPHPGQAEKIWDRCIDAALGEK